MPFGSSSFCAPRRPVLPRRGRPPCGAGHVRAHCSAPVNDISLSYREWFAIVKGKGGRIMRPEFSTQFQHQCGSGYHGSARTLRENDGKAVMGSRGGAKDFDRQHPRRDAHPGPGGQRRNVRCRRSHRSDALSEERSPATAGSPPFRALGPFTGSRHSGGRGPAGSGPCSHRGNACARKKGEQVRQDGPQRPGAGGWPSPQSRKHSRAMAGRAEPGARERSCKRDGRRPQRGDTDRCPRRAGQAAREQACGDRKHRGPSGIGLFGFPGRPWTGRRSSGM